jgi:DNA repair protein RecO (recombination protein O)
MIESGTGVVLRIRQHSETSLIVRWLTVDAGRMTCIAKGARRPKSPFSGKLDLFVEADFTFGRSQRSDLHGLREVSVREFHLPLRDDVGRLQSAAYCTALLEQTTETETPLPGLFELFTGLLAQLCLSEPRPRLIFAFELKLLDALGLFPPLGKTSLKNPTRELVYALAQGGWETIQTLQPSASMVKELSVFLHRFLTQHLGNLPKGRVTALHA